MKDVIAGFFMLVEDQFALGDVIEAAGKSGVVEKITLRVVVLRDLDGTLHTIPNGEIKSVSNKTRGWSRAVVDVAIAYGEDVDRAIRVIRDEAERLAHDEELAALLDGVPEVWGVESVNDTATVIRMVARTQPGSHWGVQREFRRRIKNRLDAEGIRTPAPRSTGQDPDGSGRHRRGHAMTLALYNTMSRTVEPFEPLTPGRVALYACGPTVYNYAHIGNFRTFLFEDLLRRWLEASGYDVFHVMNLTDVDDKTIRGRRRGPADPDLRRELHRRVP